MAGVPVRVSTSARMAFLACLLLRRLPSTFALACSESACYGTMNEVAGISPVRDTVVFARPDGYSPDAGSDMARLRQLLKGGKLSCGNDTFSSLETHAPWTLWAGIHLKPSCQERQTLKRVSSSSLDWESTQAKDLASFAAAAGHAPCAILSLGNHMLSVESFALDNEACMDGAISSLPSWVSAAVSLLMSKWSISGVAVHDLSGSSEILLHLGSRLPKGYGILSEDVNITGVRGGGIHLGALRGELRVSDSDLVVQSSSMSSSFSYVKVKKIVEAFRYFGAEQLLAWEESSLAEGKKCAGTSTLLEIFLPVLLAFFLVGVCFWKCCSSGDSTAD